MHIVETSLLDLYQKNASLKNDSTNNTSPLLIAYSGGLDSSVLLYASYQLLQKQLIPSVKALHVNHGIEKDSDSWQVHCESTCKNLSITLQTKQLNLSTIHNQTSENTARTARYDFFKSKAQKNSLIAFGHHLDDQAETLLFRLFRGTGISGAAAISENRVLGDSLIIRPFLNLKKSELLEYAQQNQLNWIEDSSNVESLYSRNIIRNEILPLIKNTWPKVTQTLTSFSLIASEQTEILLEVANSDLREISSSKNKIDVNKLLNLSIARQKNVIYFWIAEQKESFSKATSQEIIELIQQLNQSMTNNKSNHVNESKLNVKLGGFRVRFFDNKLWLCNLREPIRRTEIVRWKNIKKPVLVFKERPLYLSTLKNCDEKLTVRAPHNDETVTVRFRQGGEKAKPHYRDKACELKKIYQELKIPYWQREWLPIVYYNEKIVAVPGAFVSGEFVAKNDEPRIEFLLSSGND